MKKIVKYELVWINLVEKFLEDGWELYGNPIVSIESNCVYQAMVKYEE